MRTQILLNDGNNIVSRIIRIIFNRIVKIDLQDISYSTVLLYNMREKLVNVWKIWLNLRKETPKIIL